jgi:hypothetical protein
MDAGFDNEDERVQCTLQTTFPKQIQVHPPTPRNDTDAYGTADEQYNPIINTDRFKLNKDFKEVG